MCKCETKNQNCASLRLDTEAAYDPIYASHFIAEVRCNGKVIISKYVIKAVQYELVAAETVPIPGLQPTFHSNLTLTVVKTRNFNLIDLLTPRHYVIIYSEIDRFGNVVCKYEFTTQNFVIASKMKWSDHQQAEAVLRCRVISATDVL